MQQNCLCISTMDTIPEELLLFRIFMELSIHDAFALSMVSRRFNRIFKDSHLWWHYLSRDYDVTDVTSMDDPIEQYKRKLSRDLHLCENDGHALRNVKCQTMAMCRRAIQSKVDAIRFVKKQTPELCHMAVDINPRVLGYITNQTREICLKAVQKEGRTLMDVVDQTHEICKAAVSQDADALDLVNDQTEELAKIALLKKSDNLLLIKNASLRRELRQKMNL